MKKTVRKSAKAGAVRTTAGLAKTKPAPSILDEPNVNYRRLREFINPFKGLTVAKAITLLEEAQRGQYANVQWTYEVLERRYPELGALITRRISALKEMDWQIKTVTPEAPDAAHEALATKQAEWLRATYEGISNLYEAVDTMGMAHFRGFGFAEKIRESGRLVELRKVNCWNLVKDGTIDAWKYNPNAWTYAQFQSVPGEPLPLERFVHRIVPRPIDEIALIEFLRANYAVKAWDAFMEIYAIPGGIVIGPPDMTADQKDEFKKAAEKLASGGSGYLPHGCQYIPNDGPRGQDPFSGRLDKITERLVLVGTGGKLTMLNEATGIGGSQGEVHEDAFRQIAAADAREISEIFQKQIDAEELEAAFPGQPILAYFELNFREEVDAGDLVEMLSKLSSAGLQADADEISEKVGLKLTPKQEANPSLPENQPGKGKNKELGKERLLNYSPQQARDALGRWNDGGGAYSDAELKAAGIPDRLRENYLLAQTDLGIDDSDPATWPRDLKERWDSADAAYADAPYGSKESDDAMAEMEALEVEAGSRYQRAAAADEYIQKRLEKLGDLANREPGEASPLDREQVIALRKLLPTLVGAPIPEKLEEELASLLGVSFVAGVSSQMAGNEPLQNANPYHDERGRFASKGTAYTETQMVASIDAALTDAETGAKGTYSMGPIPQALADRVATQTGIDVTGYDLRIDADFVRHARAYHPNLTDDDFRQIPQLISTADSLTPSTTNRGLQSVEFRKQVSDRHWLLIGAQLTKQKQLQMVTLKKSSRGGKRP